MTKEQLSKLTPEHRAAFLAHEAKAKAKADQADKIGNAKRTEIREMLNKPTAKPAPKLETGPGITPGSGAKLLITSRLTTTV